MTSHRTSMNPGIANYRLQRRFAWTRGTRVAARFSHYYWLIMQTEDYWKLGWCEEKPDKSIRNSNNNMFRSFRMVGRIVANGCTRVPDEKQEYFVQIASSSNGARRKERFECGSNSRFVIIKYRKLRVLLVGFLSWRPGGWDFKTPSCYRGLKSSIHVYPRR